jgi:hypothetical protein
MMIRSVSLKGFKASFSPSGLSLPSSYKPLCRDQKALNLFWTILSMKQLLEILVEYSALTVGDGRPLRVPRNQLFAE